MQVLAVRLYSGPSYQPINSFLRQLSKLSGEFRIQMAHHHNLTFSATCAHLCSAVRKLALLSEARRALKKAQQQQQQAQATSANGSAAGGKGEGKGEGGSGGGGRALMTTRSGRLFTQGGGAEDDEIMIMHRSVRGHLA